MARDKQRVLEHSARIAQRYLGSGQLGRALVICDGLVASDPQWWRGAALRAEVLHRLGRRDEARDELSRARDLAPSASTLSALEARLAEAASPDPEVGPLSTLELEALSSGLQSFTDLRPGAAATLRAAQQLALALVAQSRFADAETLFAGLALLAPRDVYALNALGVLRLERGDLGGARSALEQGRSAAPGHRDILTNLAEVYLRLRQPVRAAACLRTLADQHRTRCSDDVWRRRVDSLAAAVAHELAASRAAPARVREQPRTTPAQPGPSPPGPAPLASDWADGEETSAATTNVAAPATSGRNRVTRML